jgi:RNA polymerase sigma-70 factor (ECF subfamily)
VHRRAGSRIPANQTGAVVVIQRMGRGGDGDELSRLLVEGYGRAYRTAYLIMRDPGDAEDAVQEAFLRVWRFRDALPEGDGVQPWLYRVLVNTCYSQLRREVPRRNRAAGDGAFETMPTAGPSPEAMAASGDTASVVMDALDDLPDQLRVPAVLRYWTGLSEKEIAVAIRRRPGTVKSRLHEARRRLAADPRVQALGPRGEAFGEEVAR